MLIILATICSFLSISSPAKAQEIPKIDQEYKSLETLARGLYYLESMYVDPTKVQRKSLALGALKGIVANLDPHTIVMPSKAFEQLTIDTKGKFGGVGIIVSTENEKLEVIAPIEGTPAEKAGIQHGDIIVKIEDKPVADFPPGKATDAMRGPPGSTLSLTIQRPGQKELIDFDLQREIIKVRSVRSVKLGDEILYTKISSFQDETANELRETIEKNPHNKGMILDLRDNPGGLLDQAIKVSDMFVSSGVIVSTVGRDANQVEREFAHKRGTYSNFPVIVLINSGSASASEIVAGALQDHERAIILGSTSFGKGSVQTLVSLPDGSGLKITVARYYTPKDRSIQAKGITPDILVARKKQSFGKKQRKEQDLKGHITGQDLSDLSEKSNLFSASRNWPNYAKSDNQLVTAFTYLKGWGLIKKP